MHAEPSPRTQTGPAREAIQAQPSPRLVQTQGPKPRLTCVCDSRERATKRQADEGFGAAAAGEHARARRSAF